MAEFEDTLNAILSDPDTMGQIMALAGKLGGGDPPPQTQDPPPEQPFPLPDLGQVGKLLELVQSCQGPDRQTMALVNALRPFLRPDRQEKLDRALRMAGLSQAARQAYQLWKEGELHV